MVGAHQAQSINAVAAPWAMPASRAAPVLLPGGVALQALRVGLGRYWSRRTWFCSKPPEARITPRRACSCNSAPSRRTVTPLTRPLSVTRPQKSVLSHSGTSRSISERRSEATNELPRDARRSILLLRRHLKSSL
ncbi:hypothetical protein D3C84_745680 [compost metagenome]